MSADLAKGAPLSQQVIKGLNDKLYEKRKVAALEVEKIIKDLLREREKDVSNNKGPAEKNQRIREIVQFLLQDFAYSVNSHARNGGLIGLATTAIALGPEIVDYLDEIIPPVIACLSDQEARVRFHACESLYNISKVARGGILKYFSDIFDSLCKLAADADTMVKGGAEPLDRLIKDIVTENASFDVDRFVALLSERIYVRNPFARSFLVNWIMLLDSVPEIDMVAFLPDFLDGLLEFCSDINKDVRVQTAAVLGEFMNQIKSSADSKESQHLPVDYARLLAILIPHASALNEEKQATALSWIKEFIVLAKEVVLQYAPDLLSVLLPAVSHSIPEIKSLASDTNILFQRLVLETDLLKVEKFQFSRTVETLTQQFLNDHEETRINSLEWLIRLHKRNPDRILSYDDGTFTLLLKNLSDPSEEYDGSFLLVHAATKLMSLVVRYDLQLLAQISSSPDGVYFQKFMMNLLSLFSTDRKLLETRGSLIIRQLCLWMNPEMIYRSMAEILERDEDLEFASTMVQNLHTILITSVELSDLRKKLRDLDGEDSQKLFTTLYRSWCHNKIATFSLCLLAQLYEDAANLLPIFAELEFTVSFLIQIDKLVQLLESPVFTYLRLQLLEPERYPHLFRCLYGLLMLLPQSSAFTTLRNRLNSVSSMGVLHLLPKGSEDGRNRRKDPAISTDGFLDHFKAVQSKHERARKLALIGISKPSQRRRMRTGNTSATTQMNPPTVAAAVAATAAKSIPAAVVPAGSANVALSSSKNLPGLPLDSTPASTSSSISLSGPLLSTSETGIVASLSEAIGGLGTGGAGHHR